MLSLVAACSYLLLAGWQVQASLDEPVRYIDLLNGRTKKVVNEGNSVVRQGSRLYRDNYDDIQELYLTQRLDHFDPLNDQTLEQRYFVTDRYSRNVEDPLSSVVFLCVGGEGPGFDESVLVDSVHCSGDMLELAHTLSTSHQIRVYVYALEHRYYGSSYPTFPNGESPVTNQNLKYLSSRQALEDLAHFVQTISESILHSSNSTSTGQKLQWITFGGSYPGYMAAYARLKYPHLIHAAVSSSAPLKLQVDFPEYYGRVGLDLKYPKVGGSRECWDIVKQGHKQAVAKLQKHPEELAQLFNVCDASTALLSKRNQELFLGDGLIYIPAQSNDPDCAGDTNDDDGEDPDLCNIERLCGYMIHAKIGIGDVNDNNASPKTELDILADVARKQRGGDVTEECVEVDWEATLRELTEPVVEGFGMRSWLWQTCTEFGFYQTCVDEDTCPYAASYHLVDMDLEICKVAFGITNVYDNVQATLDHYGGLDIVGGSRVLSVNGNVDPWSELAVQVSPKDSLPATMVQGASHHFWTHPVKSTDEPEIIQVRKYIYSVVMDWLGVIDLDDIGNGQDGPQQTLALRGGRTKRASIH